MIFTAAVSEPLTDNKVKADIIHEGNSDEASNTTAGKLNQIINSETKEPLSKVMPSVSDKISRSRD